MNKILSDLYRIIQHHIPISVALIILTLIAKSHHTDLHKFFDTDYSLFLLLTGIVIVVILNICRMNRTVRESKLIETRRNKIRFVFLVVPAFTLDFSADLIAIVIFFLSLFYFAYGTENQYLESLLSFHEYVYGLIILPSIGAFLEYNKRKVFGELKIDEHLLFCNKTFKKLTQNWIMTSLGFLVLLNLLLIMINP